MIHKRTNCRACGGARLRLFLDLGEVPLSNAYLTREQLAQPELRFPLEVYFCEDCSLAQLLHVVQPEILFSNYLYRTGTNKTIAAHNASLADAVVADRGLGKDSLVVEIASNDGSLLGCFRQRGTRTLGIEPAKNIALIAREAGIETICEFFSPAVAESVARSHGPAQAVLANNVLAHVDGTVEGTVTLEDRKLTVGSTAKLTADVNARERVRGQTALMWAVSERHAPVVGVGRAVARAGVGHGTRDMPIWGEVIRKGIG